ncbi:hypothetical protein RQP46_005179 [Phenoliferia psychrophenolica]
MADVPPPPTELSFGHWSAWVSIASSPVPIHSIEYKSSLSKTIGYIQSEDATPFTVHARNDWETVSPTDYVVQVFLDGQKMDGIVRSKNKCEHLPPNDPKRTTLRPFIFGKPSLTEDSDLACADERIIKNLGTIQISLFRANRLAHLASKPRVFNAPVQDPVLDEKSKKAALSHTTQLGESVESAIPKRYPPHLTWIDNRETPMHTFEFRYMSRALLEIKGHVEPLPESSPPPPNANDNGKKRAIETITVGDSDSDDDDEEDAKAAEVRKLKARLAMLEGSGSGEKKGKKVKREKDLKNEEGKVKFEPEEVIELD